METSQITAKKRLLTLATLTIEELRENTAGDRCMCYSTAQRITKLAQRFIDDLPEMPVEIADGLKKLQGITDEMGRNFTSKAQELTLNQMTEADEGRRGSLTDAGVTITETRAEISECLAGLKEGVPTSDLTDLLEANSVLLDALLFMIENSYDSCVMRRLRIEQLEKELSAR